MITKCILDSSCLAVCLCGVHISTDCLLLVTSLTIIWSTELVYSLE